MKKNTHFSSILLIQLAIGLYFCISGIQGIINYNSGANQLINDVSRIMGQSNYMPLITAIAFLLVGFILIAGVIANLKVKLLYFIVFILWAVYMVINFFTDGFMKPDAIIWLKNFSMHLIVLAGLWGVTQRNS